MSKLERRGELVRHPLQEDPTLARAIGNLLALVLVARRGGQLRALVVRLGDAAGEALATLAVDADVVD